MTNLYEYEKTFAKIPQRDWKALQAFYRLKSLLLPDFIQRNKRSLNSIEAEIIRQYEDKTH